MYISKIETAEWPEIPDCGLCKQFVPFMQSPAVLHYHDRNLMLISDHVLDFYGLVAAHQWPWVVKMYRRVAPSLCAAATTLAGSTGSTAAALPSEAISLAKM